MRIRFSCEKKRSGIQENGISNLSKLTHVLSGFLNILQPPTVLQIEPTTRCNLKCKHCLRSSKTNGDMSLNLFKSIINQLGKPKLLARRIYLTGLGEPLLNPEICSMVEYAKERGFEAGFTSNFTLVNRTVALNLIKAGLDHLSISIDGASHRTFEKIRVGGSFGEVVENVRVFVGAKAESLSRTPKLVFSAVITDQNVDEMHQIVKLGEALGVDGVCFSERIMPNQSDNRNDYLLSLGREELCGRQLDIELVRFQEKQLPCLATRGCYVTFDGQILPCSSIAQMVPREDYPKFTFGSLDAKSFHDIWYSRNYREFRTRLILGSYQQFCQGCPQRRTQANVCPRVND